MHRPWVLALITLLMILPTRTALADEVAPDLEGSDLRIKAQTELRRIFTALPTADQRRLTGIYVAFDSSVSDPIAQIACDDDGDYVVLMSDAMLKLISFVARAETHDEVTGEKRIRERLDDAGSMNRVSVRRSIDRSELQDELCERRGVMMQFLTDGNTGLAWLAALLHDSSRQQRLSGSIRRDMLEASRKRAVYCDGE